MAARVAAQQQAMGGKQQQPPPHYSQQSSRGYPPPVAGQPGKPGHPQQAAHGQQPHPQQGHVQGQGSKASSRGSSSMGTSSHNRSHTADPASHQGLAQQSTLTRQTGRTSLPGPGGHHSQGQQRTGHPQQQGMPQQHPQQQGHHGQGPPPYREPTNKHGVPPGNTCTSKGSRIPSLFDLPDSPEKKGGGGSSMPPGYPQATGLPPPYPEASSRASSGLPAQAPLFPTNPLSPGFERHTKPRPPEQLSRGASLEPGELMDTPTPTHIKNMVQGFPFPKSGVPPGFPKMEKPNEQLNASLPNTFPTSIEKAAPNTSQLHQSLFDPDYDDFGDSTFNLGDLLTNSLADPKEETSSNKQRAPAENFTATCDLSALFEDQDS